MTTARHVPGLLLCGNWIPPVRTYEESGISSLTEIILSERDKIFPGYYVSEFDLTLGPDSEEPDLEEPEKADVALVAQDYQAWYLLFVEASRNADVDSLATRLKAANLHDFGGREALYLRTKHEGLDLDQTRSLLQHPPRFVVVTDDPRHNWNDLLFKSDIKGDIMIVEPFIHDEKYVLRLNGETPPQIGINVVATCTVHTTIANCLEVNWNNPNFAPQAGSFSMKYGNVMTEWILYHGNPESVLVCSDSFPLRESPPFDIIEAPDGSYSIRKST